MRGRSKTDWWGVVLEAPDAHALADFYSSLLGWPISKQDPGGTAIQVPGPSSYLSFDNAPDYAPPVWPATPGHQRLSPTPPGSVRLWPIFSPRKTCACSSIPQVIRSAGVAHPLHQQPSYGAHGDVPYCAHRRSNAAFCLATDASPAVPG